MYRAEEGTKKDREKERNATISERTDLSFRKVININLLFTAYFYSTLPFLIPITFSVQQQKCEYTASLVYINTAFLMHHYIHIYILRIHIPYAESVSQSTLYQVK